MASLVIFYMLISIVLVVIAVLVQVKNTSLSLPVSPYVSICTIILPIISFLNTGFHAGLLRKSRASSKQLGQLAPFILQTLQGLATTVLATLLFEGMIPSSELECKIDSRWTSMFRTHDTGHIRRIQDSLNCCGLNSVKDRAYPFPGQSPSTCAETFGRTTACRGPWRNSLQTSSGTGFVVVGLVGLMQIFGLYVMKYGTRWWNFAQRDLEGQSPENHESGRPLLTSGIVEDEESEQRDTQTGGYGGVNGAGSRLEPSSLNAENEWSR